MKKSTYSQLFVFIMIMLSTMLLAGVSLSQITNAQPSPSASTPATTQTKPETLSSAKNPKQQYQQVSVVAVAGSSQSKLAANAVEQIKSQKYIDDATAGKLQDKIMHYMGYRDLIAPGDPYTLDAKTIDDLIYNAYVYDHEIVFWQEYAQKVGLATI
jgi:uncharacterized iron-regulated membrane protein